MLKTFTKEAVLRYVLEAVLIVFSVLLALFLDQSITERREARNVDLVVGHITEEMESNLNIVVEWLPYHENVIVNIDRYLDSVELRQELLEKNGINYFKIMKKGVLQDFYSVSAWEIAQQSQVTSKLNFEITRAISHGYYSQEYVNGTLKRLFDFMLSREALDPEQLTSSLMLLRNLMQELVGQEHFMRKNYEHALKQLEKNTS